MKLVMTLLVRDADDLLTANLEYHLSQGVDHFVVTDNRSTDGTREILEAYRARGLVDLIDEPADNYAQGKWVTRMARRAARELGADWVINNDADEFWWPPEGGDLKALLAACPEGTAAMRAQRLDFVPTPAAEEQPFHEAMVVRERASRNVLDQPLPPKVCHRASLRYRNLVGNHVVQERRGPLRLWRDLQTVDLGMVILHFPRITYGKFERKIRLGGAALKRNLLLSRDTGAAWRKLHDLQLQGGLRGYWDEQLHTQEELEERVRRGELALDTRLRDHLRPLLGAAEPTTARRPEASP